MVFLDLRVHFSLNFLNTDNVFLSGGLYSGCLFLFFAKKIRKDTPSRDRTCDLPAYSRMLYRWAMGVVMTPLLKNF